MAGLPVSYLTKLWGWKSTFLVELLMVVQVVAYFFFYTAKNRKQASFHAKVD